MRKQEVFEQCTIAISISDSPDMPALGLSEQHLRDAMAEIARHLLALGARLAYGGDLRQRGFSELLFELIARHRRDADEERGTGIKNYLSWPAHILLSATDIETVAVELEGSAEIVCLRLDGARMPITERLVLSPQQPTEAQWSNGLTAMRQKILAETDAQIVLGGRVENYKGVMPGIAEEALLALQCGQPIYLLGGFGGCARDIAETIGLVSPGGAQRTLWQGRSAFETFTVEHLNNGLTAEENTALAKTPHLDQVVMLILRGLMRVVNTISTDGR